MKLSLSHCHGEKRSYKNPSQNYNFFRNPTRYFPFFTYLCTKFWSKTEFNLLQNEKVIVIAAKFGG